MRLYEIDDNFSLNDPMGGDPGISDPGMGNSAPSSNQNSVNPQLLSNPNYMKVVSVLQYLAWRSRTKDISDTVNYNIFEKMIKKTDPSFNASSFKDMADKSNNFGGLLSSFDNKTITFVSDENETDDMSLGNNEDNGTSLDDLEKDGSTDDMGDVGDEEDLFADQDADENNPMDGPESQQSDPNNPDASFNSEGDGPNYSVNNHDLVKKMAERARKI